MALDIFWICLGSFVLVLTVVDCLRTVLNYDEPGTIVIRVVRGVWVMTRSFIRRLKGRPRKNALRQVTGLLMISVVLCWLIGIIFGYAFIYFGASGLGAISRDQGAPLGFWDALYLSLGQFSTVGAPAVVVTNAWVDYATVIQALTSVILLSLIITFQVNVFSAVRSLRDLCGNFNRPGASSSDPIDSLAPYFPNHKPRQIEQLMAALADGLNAYSDDLRQNRFAYYFQSGRPGFSLPFAMRMTASVAGALRWGVPGSSHLRQDPNLIRLVDCCITFHAWLHNAMNTGPLPDWQPVSKEAFARYLAGDRPEDQLVQNFLHTCGRMNALIGNTQPAHVDDAYQRYTEWLPFANAGVHLLAFVTRDLDWDPSATEDVQHHRFGHVGLFSHASQQGSEEDTV